MARLIDADAYIKMMEEKCDDNALADKLILKVCKGGIRKMPTVDAVEVVRCKDCVYGSQDPLIDIGTNCGLMGISMLHDSFCSWSMKRDGGKE